MKQWLFVLPFLMNACTSTSDQGKTDTNPGLSLEEQREVLIQRNREMLRLEREEIQAWVDSSSLPWVRTGTGLRVAKLDSTGGSKIEREDIIQMTYTLGLLNGDVLKSSSADGLYTMRVDKDNDAVVGLHEAALLLNRGDSAAILIPSHLGWGIAGDQMGIPLMSPVLYHVRILDNQ